MRNTYKQAAEKFGCSVNVVRRMVKRKQIGIIRLNHKTRLISDSEIDRVLTQRTQKALV